jgi:co-chaperonin GroES (HSP10)
MNVRASRDRIAVTKEKPETAKVVALGKGRGNDKDEVFPLEATMAFDDRRARRVWNTLEIIAGQWRHTQTLRPNS